MSGSGPIYEYQRELTAKLEQIMRERDEARAEVERFRNAVREKERLELEAVKELDEARAEGASTVVRGEAMADELYAALKAYYRECGCQQTKMDKVNQAAYAALRKYENWSGR
jgi:hypothetical protein